MELSNEKDIDNLCRAVLSLENEDECRKFFEDVLTPKEISDIAQRLKAAYMLKDGRSYLEVSLETGMSTATISRVSKALERGKGYKLVIDRIK
ncbi:MAG: hypothetical protein IJY69_02195 [Clostridia bacterium]|nr:hypothetical protein [Clostridia bacterium]